MNKIGLIFALKEELDETIKVFKIIDEHKVFDLSIYECEFKDLKCFLVECGIGKVNAARCTQILIDYMKVECIFNVGVAGSVSKDVSVLDVVIANKLVQHDFNLVSFGRNRGEIPNIGTYIDCDEKLIQVASQVRDNNIKSHLGIIASGDIFIDDKIISDKIAKRFNALCVEMEGAAIAQVCYLSNVKFICIRAISDSPNAGDNKLTYDEFLIKSSEIVATFVRKMLEQLC